MVLKHLVNENKSVCVSHIFVFIPRSLFLLYSAIAYSHIALYFHPSVSHSLCHSALHVLKDSSLDLES